MKEVKKNEFIRVLEEQNLKPISSFSDSDGTSTFGYGIPAMDTDYGKNEETYARCEMRKDYVLDKWKYTYYLIAPTSEKK